VKQILGLKGQEQSKLNFFNSGVINQYS